MEAALDQISALDRRYLVKSLSITALVMVLLMFPAAGTLAWANGWIFLAVSFMSFFLAIPILARVNPEIFPARRRIQPGTRKWDRILLGVLFPAMCAIPLVAALDSVRFHWSALPTWGVALGYVLYLAGFALATYAEAVNKFFEPGVRLQLDREQHVIDTGPYRIVRHPGYISASGLLIGTALALGSLWALVPALFACLLLVGRTIAEDRMLRHELPGYEAYAQRVRFKWLPGLW